MARPGLFQHPKFLRLVHILREPEPHVLGYLECMWSVGYQNGNPVLGDQVGVELAARFPGEPGKLCKAMLDCGFVDALPEGRFQIHDLLDHAPEYVASRWARELERRKEKECGQCGTLFHSPDHRALYCSPSCRTLAWRRRKNQGVDGLLTDGPSTFTDVDGTPAPAPAPNTKLGDESPKTPLARSREDAAAGPPEPHARERKSQPAQTPPAGPITPLPDADPVLLTFPTVGGEVKEWHLRQSKLAEYREAFPGLDALAECRKALQWLRDNPSRQKTPRGMARFLGSWLGRAQDRGAPAGNPARPPETVAERIARIRREQECRNNGSMPG